MHAKSNQIDALSELNFTRRILGRTQIILDLRYKPMKYAGLIIPNMFGPGFRFCPFLTKGMRYKQHSSGPPLSFKTAEAAWVWMTRFVSGWNDHRRYTVFNKLIYYAAIIPFLYDIITDRTLHEFILKVAMTLLFVLHYFSAESETLSTISLIFAVLLGIFTLGDIGVYLRVQRLTRKVDPKNMGGD